MSESWKTRIDRWIADRSVEIAAVYDELHAMPELAWREERTTKAVLRRLGEMGLDARPLPGQTGAVALWDGRDIGAATAADRTVALRADMDALWQTVGGEERANHSCGHDAHMTMVLSALRCLKEIGWEPPPGRRVAAVFQPAEETGEGARALLRSGVMDGIDWLLGIHLRPRKELPFGKASSAIYHGGAAILSGTVKGRQAHAARPEDGINAIEAFAAAALAVKEVSAAFAAGTAPAVPQAAPAAPQAAPAAPQAAPAVPQAAPAAPQRLGSCKVTTVRAPNASSNIIPDEVSFEIDIRASSPEALNELCDRAARAVTAAAAAHGAAAEMKLAVRAMPARPDPQMERIVGEAIAEILGEVGLAPPVVTPGAEDFHFYAAEKPGLRATMVGLGCDLAPGLHDPEMTFRREALYVGTAVLALSVMKLMEDRTV